VLSAYPNATHSAVKHGRCTARRTRLFYVGHFYVVVYVKGRRVIATSRYDGPTLAVLFCSTGVAGTLAHEWRVLPTNSASPDKRAGRKIAAASKQEKMWSYEPATDAWKTWVYHGPRRWSAAAQPAAYARTATTAGCGCALLSNRPPTGPARPRRSAIFAFVVNQWMVNSDLDDETGPRNHLRRPKPSLHDAA